MATRLVPPFDVDAAWERVVTRAIIALLVVALALIWGGVALSIWLL